MQNKHWENIHLTPPKKGPEQFRNRRHGRVAVKATMRTHYTTMSSFVTLKNVPYKQFTGKPRWISFLNAFGMHLKNVCCRPTRFQQCTTKGCLLAKKMPLIINPIVDKGHDFLKSFWFFATCPLEYRCQTGINEILGSFWANLAQYWPFLWAVHRVYLLTPHENTRLLLHYIYCLFSLLYLEGVKLVPFFLHLDALAASSVCPNTSSNTLPLGFWKEHAVGGDEL